MLDIAIIVAVLAGGALAREFLTSAGDRKADELWTSAARRVGGEVEITQARFLRPAERRIRLTVEDVPLVVFTANEAPHGNSHASYTRILAGPLPSVGEARIHAAKRDLIRKLSKRLGIDELPTGHATFDDAVHLSGAPKGVALAFFDKPTRSLVVDSDAGFDIEGGFVVVHRAGLPQSSDPLIAMTRFAERLVQRWCLLQRGPARLAARLSLTEKRGWELGPGADCIATGVVRLRTVTLSVRVDDEVAFSVLTFEDPSAGEWAMERGDGEAFDVSGSPPDAVRAFATGAPSALLGMRSVAGTAEIVFEGLCPDREEVAASLDVLLEATAPRSPYR